MPMLVPSPPLSLITTVLPERLATAASSGRTSSRCGTSVSGSMVSSGMVPVAFDRSCSWKPLNTDTASSGTPAARILSVAARRPSVVMRQPYDAGMARDPEKSARRTELRGPAARARRRPRRRRRRARLADHVLGLLDELGLGRGAVVTSYVAVPGEPPTAPLNAALAAHGIRVLVPITLPDFDLDWHDAADNTAAPSGSDAVAARRRRARPGPGGRPPRHPDGPGRWVLRPRAAPPAAGHPVRRRAAPRRAPRPGGCRRCPARRTTSRSTRW